MTLRKFLKNEFGIRETETLPYVNVTVKSFLKKIEKRGTENNIITNLLGFQEGGITNDQTRAYLAGVAQRVMKTSQK